MNKKVFKLGIVLLSICWFTLSWAALPDFTELAAKAGKAVVNIGTVKVVKRPDVRDFFKGLPRQGHPFEEFFDQFERFFGRQFKRPQKQRSLGSGFIISKDGYIVTNNHVIDGADEIKVKFQDEYGEKTYDAKIIGTDPETDLALLKIEADIELPTLKFGDSDKIKVGQWVVAIGNPFGLDHTVTAGIVSAKGRIIGAGPYDNFIQTDASINPGNSGGPLLDLNGEVIGINTAIIASGQGIGFAIPSNLAKNVIEQLKKHKKVKRGWLGVSIQNLDENTAKALGLETPKGALVASVTPGDPADKAGIKAGDVIIAVEGQVVENASDLTRRIGELLPGAKIKITIWRKGKVKDLYVTLGERSIHKLAKNGSPEPEVEESVLGLSLRSVRPEEAKALGLDKVQGLLVTGVQDGSKADLSGVRAGDVILEVNGQEVHSIQEFKRIFETDAKKKKVLMLLIKRDGQNLFRIISLED
ncbi:DegQ family serine endoprotease [Desulfohalobiaceae bacterium Ax17]|uniref:DegQ family serine endoprotease n=1 Tax=Desulfovulcanus ferrireducens TaxID=2831190 RepID=UPI00207B9943|nr:DegQ family serine endoprotease [Desulfovulcanus ferrireducens]MBT8763955.1 DegQ family serine endoprotease [Desulfovulcanus ferrireducens]